VCPKPAPSAIKKSDDQRRGWQIAIGCQHQVLKLNHLDGIKATKALNSAKLRRTRSRGNWHPCPQLFKPLFNNCRQKQSPGPPLWPIAVAIVLLVHSVESSQTPPSCRPWRHAGLEYGQQVEAAVKCRIQLPRLDRPRRQLGWLAQHRCPFCTCAA
jgi:hypothetical protein